MNQIRSYKKNDQFEVYISDFSDDGSGIGHTESYTWFIKDAVIGDRVLAAVTKVKKNYGFARTVEIIEPSPDRVMPPCPVSRACGGCQIQQLKYEAQLKFKEQKVLSDLRRIGGIDIGRTEDGIGMDCAGRTIDTFRNVFIHESGNIESAIDMPRIEPIIGMEEPFRYRNKAIYPIGKNKEGRIIAGFFAGRTHSIIECEDCLIGEKENMQILRVIIEHMNQLQIEPYDEVTGKGTVRHVMIRKGHKTGMTMVCIVINAKVLKGEAELSRKLADAVPDIKTISICVNTKKTNVVMDGEIRHIYGSGYIEDEVDGVRFKISPRSFFQVNPVQMEKLYNTALEFAGLTGHENVWDLYCGVGTISLFLARKAHKVYGVEVVPEAIEDARENARINGIGNVEFFVGRAEEVLPRWYRESAGGMQDDIVSYEVENMNPAAMADNKYAVFNTADVYSADMAGNTIDVIVVDPPRKGCDEQCLKTIVDIAPKRVVYVSCDPATLARDIKYLSSNGYRLDRVRPCDMFPHTVHVETVCQLVLRKPVVHVNIDVDVDELVQDKRGLATYEQIKTYVQEHSGMKVNNLYIAQVKRKYGIIERENYNKPKSEDARQPQCPPEKEEAIKAALEHFGMI